MPNQAIIKEYSNGEVTIVWQPAKCIHSTICFRSLPQVFNPQERPWVKITAATTARLIEQVKSCPSGALSYKLAEQARQTAPAPAATEVVKVKVAPNGPLIVQGAVEIQDKQGKLNQHTKVALCRCGASANKPYCDGSHQRIGFSDD